MARPFFTEEELEEIRRADREMEKRGRKPKPKQKPEPKPRKPRKGKLSHLTEEERKEYRRAYNREYMRTYMRDKRAANLEESRAYERERYQQRRDKVLAKYRKNPERNAKLIQYLEYRIWNKELKIRTFESEIAQLVKEIKEIEGRNQ